MSDHETYAELCRTHRWNVPERYNIAADVCDKHPRDKPAMVWESFDGSRRELVWGELQDMADRAAHLLQRHGVKRGDRVAVVLPPTPETAAVFFGVWKLGAVLLSLSLLYGDEAIEHRLRGLAARAGRDRRGQRRALPRRGRADLLVLAAEGWSATPEPHIECDTAADDPAQLYYTSGTTGLAKGVVHAHRYLLAHEEFVYCHEVQDGESFHGMGEWAWAAGIAPLLGPWRLGAVQYVYRREARLRRPPPARLPQPKRRLQRVHHADRDAGDDGGDRRRQPLSAAVPPRLLGRRAAQPRGDPLVPRAVRVTVLDYYGLTESYPLVANYPWHAGARGVDGPADAGLGRADPGRGRAAGGRRRARRDLPARALEPALPARLLEPARRHRGGVRRRVVPHQGCRRAGRGRLLLVRGPGRRRDHRGRLPDRARSRSSRSASSTRRCARRPRSPHRTSCAATWSRRSSCWPRATIHRTTWRSGSRPMSAQHLSAYAYPRLIEFVDELPKTLTGKIRRIELRQLELRARGRLGHATLTAARRRARTAARSPCCR